MSVLAGEGIMAIAAAAFRCGLFNYAMFHGVGTRFKKSRGKKSKIGH
jgi:hypothetical protein